MPISDYKNVEAGLIKTHICDKKKKKVFLKWYLKTREMHDKKGTEEERIYVSN